MREIFLILVILIFVDFSSCLKCYMSGLPWSKECSPVIHEKYGARPACLWAIIIDGKKIKFLSFLNLKQFFLQNIIIQKKFKDVQK